jgi:hypothetical protein
MPKYWGFCPNASDGLLPSMFGKKLMLKIKKLKINGLGKIHPSSLVPHPLKTYLSGPEKSQN